METINLNTETFRKNLYDLINKSNLPISNIYLIMSIIYKELQNTYYATLNSEIMKMNEEQRQNQQQNKEEAKESTDE